MSISKDSQKMIHLMLEKSQESFLLAIEIYNKPTIKFRVEGFCFFICGAWELLLKAYLLKTGKQINYKKKNINRTLSLSDAIKQVMTNDKDPQRINLETVVGIRNMASHLIIPEYAILLNDVFVACVKNYSIKLSNYFDISINCKIPSNFLTLFIPSTVDTIDVLTKYGKQVNSKLNSFKTYLGHVFNENQANGVVNDNFAMTYQLSFKQVKSLEDADLRIAKTNKQNSDASFVHVATDPNKTHPMSRKQVIDMVKSELKLKNIVFTPVSANAQAVFNSYTMGLYINKMNIKNDNTFCFCHIVGNNKSFTYSFALVQRIVDDITADPDIFKKIK